MKITHEGIEYKFYWNRVGWSYAEINVQIKSKLFGLIPYWKTVWSTSSGFSWGPATVERVEKAHKGRMEEWARSALKEYIAYEKSWSE